MTADLRRLADYWAAALWLSGRRDNDKETILADADWTYPQLTFQKVDQSSMRSCQLHLDLTADDRLVEVERLRDLGAQRRTQRHRQGQQLDLDSDGRS